MGLTNRKEEQLKEMPLIRSSISKTKDGKCIVHRTTITHVKPVQYYDAILNGDELVQEYEDDIVA